MNTRKSKLLTIALCLAAGYALVSALLMSGMTVRPATASGAAALDGSIYVPDETGMGSLQGTAYEDKNANAKWDAGEPRFGGAWYKVASTGNWYVCGTTGDDASFGVTVQAGVYFLTPVNLAGWRATTPVSTIVVRGGQANSGNDIGYVKDPATGLEGCDQYNPSRK